MAPLHYAASFGNVGTMRIPARIRRRCECPQCPGSDRAGALGGDEAKTRYWWKKGADVNAASNSGRTALMGAAGRNGGDAMVRFLIAKGADASSRLQPATLLARRCRECGIETVRLLVRERRDVNATSYTGNTPPWRRAIRTASRQ